MEPIKVGQMKIAGRLVTEADRAFLRAVYASVREEELAPVPWTTAQKQAFLDHQFNAQDRSYREHNVGSEWLVLTVDGQDAGRLYVHRRPTEIHIIEIALLPLYRRRGIGEAVLRSLLAEGEASGKPVRIHVERFNPAKRLYERLGFRVAAEAGEVYLLMEWAPKRA